MATELHNITTLLDLRHSIFKGFGDFQGSTILRMNASRFSPFANMHHGAALHGFIH